MAFLDNVNKVCLRSVKEEDKLIMAEIKTLLGVSYRCSHNEENNNYLITCVGSGYTNFNQRMQ